MDDQYEVLKGTREYLTSMHIPEENILLARDGQQGIKTALREKPDVIVTDIMMPGMDGLSMINQLRKAGAGSRMIVLSAYSEFGFAKQAISLGVSEYLVKPVTRQQVCTAVVRQLSSLHDVASHDMFCGLLLSSYLSGHDFYTRSEDVMQITGLSHFDGEWWMLALVDVSTISSEDGVRHAVEALSQAAEADVVGSVFRIYAGPLLVVLNAPDADRMGEVAARFADVLSARDENLCGGFSALGRGVESLPKLYRQASEALSRSKKSGDWQMERVTTQSDYLVSAQSMEAMALAISGRQNESGVWHMLDEIFAQLTLADADQRDKCAALEAAMCTMCKRFGVPDLMPAFRYEDQRSLFVLKQLCIGVVRKLLSQEAMPNSFAKIRKAVEYINQNYASDCSVAFLANYVDFSYAYFSATFTRVMGLSATEYVLSVRLENAERMLSVPCERAPISVIAARCGFENPRYFSTCFKNRYGKSPSEY